MEILKQCFTQQPFKSPFRSKDDGKQEGWKSGKISFKSKKREHEKRISFKFTRFCQGLGDFFNSFCCTCGEPDVFIGNKEVGEEPKFISKEQELIQVWNQLNKGKKDKLGLKEVKLLLKKINASVPEREVVSWMESYDNDNDSKVSFEEFKKMYFSLRSLPDLRQEFYQAYLKETEPDKIIEESGITFSPKWQWAKQQYLVPDQLAWFLQWASNGEDKRSIPECEQLIKKYSRNSHSLPSSMEQIGENSVALVETSSTQVQSAAQVEGRRALLPYDSFVEMVTDLVENTVFNREMTENICQDMNQPLSHYFISASHNSYLVGNQINSESSPEALKRVLKLGVRVIELDCWDGNDGLPIVNHGKTLCKPTSFESCIRIIDKFAFHTSEYPLVVTLENHCSRKQQKKQVKIMQDIFQDKLYIWNLNKFLPAKEGSSEKDIPEEVLAKIGPVEFQSPMALKRKIIIRQRPVKKMTKKEKEDLKTKVKELQTRSAGSGTAESLSREDSELKIERSASINSGSSNDYDEHTVKRTLIKQQAKEKEARKSSKGVHRNLLRVMYLKNINLPLANRKENPEETRLVASTDSKKKKDMRPILLKDPEFASTSSLNENDMKRLVSPGQNSAAINTYTKRHIIRVYPAVTRINSSNFDPMPAWNAGCQIVALNYQFLNFRVWLNHGKFLLNKGCGFILKPKAMLEATPIGVIRDEEMQARAVDSLLPRYNRPWNLNLNLMKPSILKVSVLSAHYLPKKTSDLKYKIYPNPFMINPFVELKLRGLHKVDAKTKWIESNGYNPRWNETFAFKVYNKELCLLAFIVKSREKNSEGSFVAQRVLPVNAIRSGYRTVSLLYKNCSRIISAHLVCRFWWEDEVYVSKFLELQ